MWRTVQIILVVLGLGLAFVGDKFSIPFFFNSGIACLGVFSMAIGAEAIVTRHIVIGQRRHGSRQSYSGIPAMLQGVQFNILGLFLIAIAIMTYLRANGREFFLQMVRHPGLPLIVIGMIVLSQAGIVLIGSDEFKDPARRNIFIDLILLRLLPGGMIAFVGLASIGLGLFELVAPNAFDAMGGGFLETLYGLR